jgi:hypothetical protein
MQISRRLAVKSLISAGILASMAPAEPDIVDLTIPPGSECPELVAGKGQNAVIRLWKCWEKAAQKWYEPHFQQTGDCASHAMALGLETQAAVNCLKYPGKYRWPGKLSTEALYIAARIEIGKAFFGHGEGTWGCHMCRAAMDIGTLPRADYDGFKVSRYNSKLADELSDAARFMPGEGVPADIEALMGQSKLKSAYVLDGGFEQACDFLSCGYPILVCSEANWTHWPDDDGFVLDNGYGGGHATLLWGCDNRSDRKGGCLANSHGSTWIYGTPMHKYGTPTGGFWLDADFLDTILQNDCYAIVEYTGVEI